MTLRRTVGKWIQEGGTFLFIIGIAVKLAVELSIIGALSYPTSIILEHVVPIGEFVQLATGQQIPSNGALPAAPIITVFILCRWDQPEAAEATALRERLSLWASEGESVVED